ncbi:MAG: hypothetical protein HKL88_08245 [Bacteroidia bacterium]|jgi:hypothetical protein|nr:hypothetical protein [Bacteroidia bacterium]
MKTIIKSLLIALIIGSIASETAHAQGPYVTSLQTFYDELAPYGQWVNNPTYGYVFYPNAGPGFVPYSTNGNWLYNNNYGWTWNSGYPWGWACFHYGRWNYDPSYGWFWVPDLNWGPAWVAWRSAGSDYGWAPLPSGADINVGFGNGLGIGVNFWTFVPNQYLGETDLSSYYLPRMNNDLYIGNSVFLNQSYYNSNGGYRYYGGPDRGEVERYRHRAIEPAGINEYSDRHRHFEGENQINIYNPGGREHHDRGDGGRDNAAPGNYVGENDMPQRDREHKYNNRGHDNHNYWH